MPLSVISTIPKYLPFGFRSVNQRSSNNQWVNSLEDMFRGLFLSSIPRRISNLNITNYCAPTEIRTRGRFLTFHYHYRLATGIHWYLWEFPDQLTNHYNVNVNKLSTDRIKITHVDGKNKLSIKQIKISNESKDQ